MSGAHPCRLAALVLAVVLTSGALVAQSPAVLATGDYAGRLGPLRLLLHVMRNDAGELAATLDSPDQGATGMACTVLRKTPGVIEFLVPSVHGSYTGKLAPNGQTILGSWMQGTALPLTWVREAPFVPAETPSAVDGEWKGSIAIPGGNLPAVVHVKSDRSGKEYVTFDSPTQGARGLLGENASLKGNRFTFDLPIVHGRYSGTLSQDGRRITGTWDQGQPLPLVLNR